MLAAAAPLDPKADAAPIGPIGPISQKKPSFFGE